MRSLALLICIALSAVTVALTAFTASGESRLPAIKKDCGTCHLSHTMGGEALLRAPLSELCLECHPDRKSPAEHRVDMMPTMPVLNLPLEDGKMTCVTCHDPHGKEPFPKMLRARPSKLCGMCHKM